MHGIRVEQCLRKRRKSGMMLHTRYSSGMMSHKRYKSGMMLYARYKSRMMSHKRYKSGIMWHTRYKSGMMLYTRHNSGMRKQRKKKKKITSLSHALRFAPTTKYSLHLWDQRFSLPALRKKTSALRFLSLKTLKPFCSCIPADSTISWLRPPFPDPVRVTVVSPPATKHIGFLLL